MRFVDSRCIHCGANLRLAEDATHVCCQYCNAELHVIREGGRITTEMMQAMQEDLGRKLDILRVQNEIERLDREWNLEREGYLQTDKKGVKSVPTFWGSVFGGGFVLMMAVLFGGASYFIGSIAWGILWNSSMPSFIPIALGITVAAMGLFAVTASAAKAKAHESAEHEYRAARQRLLAELDRAGREQNSTSVTPT